MWSCLPSREEWLFHRLTRLRHLCRYRRGSCTTDIGRHLLCEQILPLWPLTTWKTLALPFSCIVCWTVLSPLYLISNITHSYWLLKSCDHTHVESFAMKVLKCVSQWICLNRVPDEAKSNGVALVILYMVLRARSQIQKFKVTLHSNWCPPWQKLKHYNGRSAGHRASATQTQGQIAASLITHQLSA